MRSKKKLVNRYVGERLRRLRVRNSLKVQDVAHRAGLPASSYSCLEGGWYNINLDNLFRILQVLQADVSDVWPQGQVTGEGIVDEDAVLEVLEYARAHQPEEVSVDDVLDAVCHVYGVEREQLSSGSRRRRLSEARTVAAVLVKEIPHLTLTDLAQSLRVHISSLSHCTKRLQSKTKNDDTIPRRTEAVRKRLWNEFQKKKKADMTSGSPGARVGTEEKEMALALV